MGDKRKYMYIEAMRIIACFFVIFNHTGDKGFFLFSQQKWGSLQFWCYMFFSVFCKFSVPLFLTISGALLIARKNESITTVWKKRVVTIAAALFCFSTAYYLKEVYFGREVLDIRRFLSRLYDSDWNFSYWYLYSYIAFLITLPFLRMFAASLEDKHYHYMFMLVVFFSGILPVIQYILWKGEHSLNPNLSVGWIQSNIVFYPLLGYYLQYRVKDIEKMGKPILIAWGINIFSILACCYVTYLKAVVTGECNEDVSQSFHSSFTMINTATLFLTFKYLFVKFEDRIPRQCEQMIRSVGGCTFGIYLWHVIGLSVVERLKIWDALYDHGVDHMLTAFLACFVVMAICYCVTMLMKKIPFINKLVM